MSEARTISDIENHILEAIRQIRFGAVEVLIHDSRVVQLERIEKVRFDSMRSPNPGNNSR